MNLSSIIEKSGIKRLLPDKIYLKMKYRKHYGKPLNLEHPDTFQAKMQWLKLYYRKPIMTEMVDKYEAKDYVSRLIGDAYIVPTLAVWDSVEDIDISILPNQFVLKCTHDSGGIVICRDKAEFQEETAKDRLSKAMKSRGFYAGREWPYKHVRPRIIAETFLMDSQNEDLIDYKFYCFNGKPHYCQVIKDRSTEETIDFFDEHWLLQPFIGLFEHAKHAKHAKHAPERPKGYEHMWEIAGKLSQGFPFLRVDLYNINGNIYFGELTFYPAGGFGEFQPSAVNKMLGDLIILPKDK